MAMRPPSPRVSPLHYREARDDGLDVLASNAGVVTGEVDDEARVPALAIDAGDAGELVCERVVGPSIYSHLIGDVLMYL